MAYDERRRLVLSGKEATFERRTIDTTMSAFEVRSGADANTITVAGEASTTGNWYDVGDPKRGGFEESIRPGAFRRCLSEGCDTVLNVLHDGLPYARTTTGSLRLTETSTGLHFDADLQADDPDVMALIPKLRRGDLSGASMAFRVTSDSWNEDRSRREIRTLSLHKGDIAIVPFGANPTAYVGLADSRATESASAARVLIPFHGRRERERLSLLGASLSPRPPAMPPLAERRDYYRRRLAELRSSER